MSAKKRTAKFVAPKPESKHSPSSDSSSDDSDDDDDDFAFYQSRFPLPTTAPKPTRTQQQPNQPTAASASASASNTYQSDQWTEVHDTRKEKYQQRRTQRDEQLSLLQAEAEYNKSNEFGSLPKFVPYVRDKSGKWLGGKSSHKVKPKQLGVIEEYIVPDTVNDKAKHNKKKKSREDLLLAGGSGGSGSGSGSGGVREWSGESDMVDTIVHWIERQVAGGDEAMSVAQIGERIQARCGESWNKRYKARYGTLVEWLKTKPALTVSADRVTVTPTHTHSDEHDSRQQHQQRERDRQLQSSSMRGGEAARNVRVVSGAERSWLAFVFYVLALLAVGYGAYSVWSGRNMSDLAKQLSEQLAAMEEAVTDVTHAAKQST